MGPGTDDTLFAPQAVQGLAHPRFLQALRRKGRTKLADVALKMKTLMQTEGIPVAQPRSELPDFDQRRAAGIPMGLELDNAHGREDDEGYKYIDGLPIDITLTGRLEAVLEEKLALVVGFHRGGREA